jgi:hypothetical protein
MLIHPTNRTAGVPAMPDSRQQASDAMQAAKCIASDDYRLKGN